MKSGLFTIRMPADARLLRERRAAAAREAIAARRGGGGWAALGAEALSRFRAGMDTHAIGRELGEPEPIVAAALYDRRAAEWACTRRGGPAGPTGNPEGGRGGPAGPTGIYEGRLR